jgi:predicted nuclease with TOPRIM domain
LQEQSDQISELQEKNKKLEQNNEKLEKNNEKLLGKMEEMYEKFISQSQDIFQAQLAAEKENKMLLIEQANREREVGLRTNHSQLAMAIMMNTNSQSSNTAAVLSTLQHSNRPSSDNSSGSVMQIESNKE